MNGAPIWGGSWMLMMVQAEELTRVTKSAPMPRLFKKSSPDAKERIGSGTSSHKWLVSKELIADQHYFMASMDGWKHTSTLTIQYWDTILLKSLRQFLTASILLTRYSVMILSSSDQASYYLILFQIFLFLDKSRINTGGNDFWMVTF